VFTSSLAAVFVVLAFAPYLVTTYAVEQLTSLLTLVILAAMWNALAGYGGMVSVGQQAYIGVAAYATIFLTQRGVTPYLALVTAALASAVLAVPASFLVLRLRGGQFAIGTWVLAESLGLVVALDHGLGGGTGVTLTQLNRYAPAYRQAYTFWLTLAFTAALLGGVLLLLRSRAGAALQAIRDDAEAAASVGVPVQARQRMLYVLCAFGSGAAGALILANTLFVQPRSIFGVQWSAYMIFMVLVGGLGTFEGPILGALVLFFVQRQFADSGAWYLIGLGATAVAFALFLPRGIWGLAQERLPVMLLPIGYRLTRPGTGKARPGPR
jgi:branched-chain amino acid transport system permease protein